MHPCLHFQEDVFLEFGLCGEVPPDLLYRVPHLVDIEVLVRPEL